MKDRLILKLIVHQNPAGYFHVSNEWEPTKDLESCGIGLTVPDSFKLEEVLTTEINKMIARELARRHG